MEVLSRGEVLSSQQITSNNNWVTTNYPSSTRLATSTSKYNCHSYAWYLQSTSNSYWMDNPSAYWSDGSYTSGTKAVGSKITYTQSNSVTHSGIVSTLYSGASLINFVDLVDVTSKWGEMGLYKHKGNSCPYWSTSNTYVTYYN